MAVIGMPVIPGHELACPPTSREFLTLDTHTGVTVGAYCIDDTVIPVGQLPMQDIRADLDISEKTHSVAPEEIVEQTVHYPLLLRVIRRHTGAHQTPGGRQTLEQVNLHIQVTGFQQMFQCIHARGAGAHDGYPAGTIRRHCFAPQSTRD